jgi:hypothetical protein
MICVCFVCVMILGILDIICCFGFGAFGVCGGNICDRERGKCGIRCVCVSRSLLGILNMGKVEIRGQGDVLD